MTEFENKILEACKNKNVRKITELIKQDRHSFYGYEWELYQALDNKRIDIIEFLVENGKTYEHSEEILRWASEHGHLKIIKYLIETEINIYKHDYAVLDLVLQNNHLNIAKYLIENSINQTIYKSIEFKQFRIANYFLQTYNGMININLIKLKKLLNINNESISFEEVKKRIEIEAERQELINV